MKKLGLNLPSPERLSTVPHILNYAATQGLPLIADSADYTQVLPDGLWGMLGNNFAGNCFWVAIANMLMSQEMNVTGKVSKVYTTDDVMGWYKAYLLTQGVVYDENDPNTDQGTDPIIGMNWLVQHGIIEAWGQVAIDNDAHLATAIELYGSVLGGLSVPSGYMNSTTWGTNAGPIEGGHAIVLGAYNPQCDTTGLTWGEKIKWLNAGRRQYGNLAIAIITKAWLGTVGKTLQGFVLSDLQADLALVT